MTTPEKPSAEELSARIAALSDRLQEMVQEMQALQGDVQTLQGEPRSADAQSPAQDSEPVDGALEEPSVEVLTPEAPLPEVPLPEAPASEALPRGEQDAHEEASEESLQEEAPPLEGLEEGIEEDLPVAARSAEVPSPKASSKRSSKNSAPEAPQPEDTRADALETRIGTVWLNRIGLFSLVIGFAFLARLVEDKMVPWHRVALSYLGAALLVGVGWRYAGRLKQFARPVIAGGLAVGFFTSFAGHFLPPMACLPVGASLVLMGSFVAGVFGCAERWRSESTAGLALFLGHVAAYVASVDTDTFSMVAVLFLSATAFALVVRHDWLPLGLFSVIAAFGSYFLWALRDSDLLQRPDRFGFNLLFLTSYYLIFLATDALFVRRLQMRGRDAFTQRQRVTGRNIGPTAMASYGSLVAALFNSTGHWSNIHYLFLPMAAVQLAVLFYHRRRGSDDTPLYLTAATTFFTLGLFSMLGGLALNLALAAEALLLLILGRTINFWFLRPLAQGILLLNFVHFWLSDARNLDSWSTFIGALLMASIYFVKARLNETWAPISDDQRLNPGGGGRLSIFWREFFDRVAVPVAHLQTLSGAVLLAYQCDRFLPSPWNGAALVGLAAVAAGAGLILGSPPLLQGAWLAQAFAAFFLCRQVLGAGGGSAADSPWVVNQLVALALAVIPTVAIWVSCRAQRCSYLRFASLAFAAAIVGGFGAAVAGPTPFDLGNTGFSFLALLAPLALWVGIELWPIAPTQEELDALGIRKQRFFRMGRRRRVLLAMLVAVLGVWGSLESTASVSLAILVLSGVSLLLGGAAFLRGSPYLLLGLLTHQCLTILASLWFLQAGDPQHALVRWWMLTETVALAGGLLAACPRWRRGSFATGGLVLLGQALGLFLWLTLLPDQAFSPLALWCLPAVGLFAVIEVFRVSPARCGRTLDLWLDRRGQSLFQGYSRATMGIAAIMTSSALGLMLGRALPSQRQALWAMMIAAVILMAATLWRSSPYLMSGVATLLGLMTAHRVLYGGQLIARPVLEWASISLLMASAAILLWAAPRQRRASFAWGGVLTLTLGLVALAEFLFNQRPGPSPNYLWLLTFALAWWAVEELWRGFWGIDKNPRGWRDRIDVEHLAQRSLGLAVTFSGLAAILLVTLTWRQFPVPVTMVYVTIAYSILFVALTLALKSPPMAAGFAVCLTAAHPLLYGRIGAVRVAESSPLLALLLLCVTLAAGVAAEWIFRHFDEPGRRRPAWWGAWYPYLLGFLLAVLFLGPYGEEIFGHPAFGAPARLLIAVAAFATSRALGLRWLTRAALAYSLLSIGILLVGALAQASYRVGLVPAALMVFVELIAMERILAGQDPMTLSRKSPRLASAQRKILVAAAAVVMLFAFWQSAEVRGTWTTAGWSLLALILMMGGFLWRDRMYRRTALGIFAAALLRLFVFDVTRLEAHYAMLALLSLGACLVAGSFLYSRYREKIQSWL